MAATLQGRGFGPTTPPLLEYLQQILRGYSDGQILKELLQNAEDASASEVIFVYDQRQFGTSTLLKPGLAKFQGPAVYAFNNAKFTAEDWDGIQKPARSVKKEDVLKVGRFGIGFSSVYHLTDLPCIISDDTLAIIDPFEEYFTDERHRPLPGYSYNVRDVVHRHEISDQLAPFLDVFQGQEDLKALKSLPGTLFRFPLRTSASELCGSVFTRQEVMKLLEAFKKDSLIVLLFVRNVEKISVLLRDSSSLSPSPYIEVYLSSKNMSSFREDREAFNLQLQQYRTGQITGDIELVQSFNITSMDGTNREWITAQVISSGKSEEIRELAVRLHHIPWVGVAIPIDRGTDFHTNSSGAIEGRIFCFLPLPEGNTGFSGLPVHVHGYFGVSDDRRSLKWLEVDQIQNPTARWNKLLVETVLPDVYVKGILKAINVCGTEGGGASCVYRALPNMNASLGHWKEMARIFYRTLFKHQVLYTEYSKSWKHVREVVIIDPTVIGDLSPPLVIKCLRMTGHSIVEELPEHVLQAVKSFSGDARFVTRETILSAIRTINLGSFTVEERLQLFLYCIKTGCTPRDLDGLDLLLTIDGQFRKISSRPSSEQVLYIPTSQCGSHLLPHLPNRLIDADRCAVFFNDLKPHYEAMTHQGNWDQIQYLTPTAIVSLLKASLLGDWSGVYTPRKYLNDNGTFTWYWLKCLWDFLNRQGMLEQLKNLNMLPVSREGHFPIQLETLKVNSLIMEGSSNIENSYPDVVHVLKKIGVNIHHLPNFVTSSTVVYSCRFVNRFDTAGVLHCLTSIGKSTIDQRCQANNLSQTFREKLLPFLNPAEMNTASKNFLKSLTIYLTYSSKTNKHLVPLSANVCLLQDESFSNLPQVSFPYTVICTQQKELISLLIYHFDVREIGNAEMVKKMLVKASNGGYSQAERQILVSWIPDNYESIREFSGGVELLRNFAFVPDGTGAVRRVGDLYDPQDALMKKLFRGNQYFPSTNFLRSDRRWQQVLQAIGYRTKSRVDHSDVQNIASQISSSNNVEQGKALCDFLFSRNDLLPPYMCQRLNLVRFMPCQTQRPQWYPTALPFLGENGINNVYTPNQTVKFSEDNIRLAGSSAFFVTVIPSGILVRSEPSLQEVCSHLAEISVRFSTPSPQLTMMLHKIYHFLNSRSVQHAQLSSLPKKWIWTGQGFAAGDDVCCQEMPVDLRPLISPIPPEFRIYTNLYSVMNVPRDVTTVQLLQLLQTVRAKVQQSHISRDTDCFAELSVRILRHLLETESDLHRFKGQLLVLTETKELLPPDKVHYCDHDWLRRHTSQNGDIVGECEDIKVISDKFSIPMARKLGVTPLSRRLAMADEIVDGISQTGQYEPITTRIRNILSEAGYQASSIPKEMIQNAEDAGATKVQFLIDIRYNSNARESLLSEGMITLQGPALWIYNDSVFTDNDLQNITKLAGGTKSMDSTKIGQFGLGFNSVYHITDVPSFVTRNFVNFFDPHKRFLGRQIHSDGRGIRLDFNKNARLLKTFRDQFVPFEDIFGCHLLGGAPEEFRGTLFRLPLRVPEDAKKSNICTESWNESKLKDLIKNLCDTAGLMLLFTEHVRVISAHVLHSETEQMRELFKAERKVTRLSRELACESFGKEVLKALQQVGMQSPPADLAKTLQIHHCLQEEGRHYLDMPNRPAEWTEEWFTVLSCGKGEALSLHRDKAQLASGLLPCGGVAWKKHPREKVDGQGFCFLPLSIPKSHLPIHVSGSFALSDDRASVWKYTGDLTDHRAVFKTKWNETMFSDIILSAYLSLMKGVSSIEDLDSCYSLWPDQRITTLEGDYGAFVKSFYTEAAKGKLQVFRNSPKECAYSIGEVLFVDDIIAENESMLNQVKMNLRRFGFAKVVTKLPDFVMEAFLNVGYQSVISAKTFPLCRYLQELFVPKIEQITVDQVTTTLQFALSRFESDVLTVLQQSKCIPTSSRSRSYKLPSELYDRSATRDLFSDDEGCYPCEQFMKVLNDRQKGTLRDIRCLKTSLEWDDLISRAKTVQHLWMQNQRDLAKLRSNAVIECLRRKVEESTEKHHFQATFLMIPFLFGQDHNRMPHLKAASDLYPATAKDVVGMVVCIVDTLPSSLMEYLQLENKRPDPSLVMENLKALRQSCEMDGANNPQQRALQACKEMYRVFESECSGRKDLLDILKNENCFYVNGTFVFARKLSFEDEPVPPYSFKVTSELRDFAKLLRMVEVKEQFSVTDFAEMLAAIEKDFKGQSLPKKVRDAAVANIIKPLSEKVEELASQNIPFSTEKIYLPDGKGIMTPSSRLSFCDVDWLDADDTVLCHPDITAHQAKLLGVRDIRHQMLERYSEDVYPGEEFGQREDLTNRLKRILTGYPCDSSILKEIVQNADDACASEVHFILDFQTYRTNRLMKDDMKVLQGPALLAFNNKPFSESDIQGIQRLGVGSKSGENAKTGRYGVGFNVVYHMTDCPMFLSKGDTLCLMDPTLSYVPGASVKSPGRKYKKVKESIQIKYPDFFECFSSLGKMFPLENGTLFRFPLRRGQSDISSETWTPDKVGKLLHELKEELFDILLFLKNVRKISISHKKENHLDLTDTYTVSTHLSDEETLKRKKFFDLLVEHANTPLTEIPVKSVTSDLTLTDSDGYEEKWLVQQQLGIETKDIPASVERACRTNFSEMNLLPKGGVAARISHSNSPQSGDNKRRRLEYKVFCFLPLPLTTCLPVHIDGYFALDHESRRNLWYGPIGDPKHDWNEWIKEKLLGPAYLQLLFKLKKLVGKRVDADKRSQSVNQQLHLYHSLFPTCSSNSKRAQVSPWNNLSESLYILMSVKKCKLFPVVIPVRAAKDSRDTTVDVSWHSCLQGTDSMGYFDDLCCQVPSKPSTLSEEKSDKVAEWKILQQMLLRLHLPLLATPTRIRHSICNALENNKTKIEQGAVHHSTRTVSPDCVLTVSPESVLSFLKESAISGELRHLPVNISETAIGNKSQLQTLIEYLKKLDTFQTQLDNAPLLLTCGDALQLFCKTSKVFHSYYFDLLPNCKHEFLHPNFLQFFDERADHVIKQLTISELGKRLHSKLKESQYSSGDLVKWSCDPRTKIQSDLQKTKWMKKFWKFLYSQWKSKRYQGNSSSTPSFINECLQHLGKWSLLPVSKGNEKFLLPLKKSKQALIPAEGNFYQLLIALGCPVVDCDWAREVNYLNAVPTLYDELYEIRQVLHHFSGKCDTCKDVLHILKCFLQTNPERLTRLSPKNHHEILRFFQERFQYVKECGEVSVLKELPCYETIHRVFVPIDKRAVAIDANDIPTEDAEKWMNQHNCIFLKKQEDLKDLYKILSIEDMTTEKLYKEFILPFMVHFSDNGLWKHLGKLYAMVEQLQDRDKETQTLISQLNLKDAKIIISQSRERKRACDLFDQAVDLYRVMLPSRCFPDNPPKEVPFSGTFRSSYYGGYCWRSFLLDLGLQHEVTSSQLLKFAEELAECPFDSTDHEEDRDKVLFEHLMESHNLHTDSKLLQNLSRVPFVSAFSPCEDYTELLRAPNLNKVCISSVSAYACALVWTTEAMCPKWVRRVYHCVHQTRDKNCITKCRKMLEIPDKPSLEQVLGHTQTLCNTLFVHQTEGRGLNVNFTHLLHVVQEILKFLSGECQKRKGSPETQSCTTPTDCCSTCKDIVTKLSDVPLVPIGNCRRLCSASMVVKSWNEEENDELSLHLHQLPDNFISVWPLLHCLGATDRPSLAQYARILESLRHSRNNVIVNNPNVSAAARQAMSGFLKCLLRHQHDGKEKEVLDKMQSLYLMSSNEGQPLVLSQEIFYNDRPQFGKRLTHFPHPLLKAISQEDIGTTANIDELIRVLPDKIRPKFMSSYIQETILTDVAESGDAHCQCEMSQTLKRIFQWERFPVAIQCIVAHEMKDGNQSKAAEQLEQMKNALFTVKCIHKLETSLQFENETLLESKSNTPCLFKRQQCENIDGRSRFTVYLSHGESKSLMHDQLARKFNELFGLIKDISYLVLILGAETEDELSNMLNEVGIGTAGLEEEQFWRPPKLGTILPPDALALLHQDPMYIFNDNEYVGFDFGVGDEENIIYGRVMQRIDVQSASQEAWKAVYKVDIGDGDLQVVMGHKLYKFISPMDPDRYAVVLHQGSEDADPQSGRARPVDQEDTMDLSAVKQDITRTIEELMTLPEADRKKMLRRLMLKWHPDKHTENKEFAQEVFKHLQREIERIKGNANIQPEDFYRDVNRRARHYEEERQNWERQFRERNYGHNFNRRSRNRRRPPPSFYPRRNPVGARNFFKQAQVDLNVADSMEDSNLNWQWKCQLYFFAADKAIRSALLACGKHNRKDDDITLAAENLKDNLNVTESVTELINIVRKDSHYPRSETSRSIPQEEFTVMDYENAKLISHEILRSVETFLLDYER